MTTKDDSSLPPSGRKTIVFRPTAKPGTVQPAVRHLSLCQNVVGVRANRVGLSGVTLQDRNSPISFNVARPDTPLTWAAARGLVDVISSLLRDGIDVNSVDSTGKTAILSAATNGRTAATSALIKAGADVNRTDKQG